MSTSAMDAGSRAHGDGVGVPDIRTNDAALPVQGTTVVPMSVDRLWDVFADVRGWPRWNPCMYWARVSGGQLKVGAHLIWCFNPVRPLYLYKLPAVARIVACDEGRKVTWEVTVPPGFHALHTYSFEAVENGRCQFGSWEVAEGPAYRALRPLWLAHFRYVRDASLRGAEKLARGPR